MRLVSFKYFRSKNLRIITFRFYISQYFINKKSKVMKFFIYVYAVLTRYIYQSIGNNLNIASKLLPKLMVMQRMIYMLNC